MLVVSRKLEEELVIGDAIRLKVLEIGRSHIRLGILAPDDVRIRRGEVPVKISEILEQRRVNGIQGCVILDVA